MRPSSTVGVNGIYGPTPMRCGWFTQTSGGGAYMHATLSASSPAPAEAFNPFSCTSSSPRPAATARPAVPRLDITATLGASSPRRPFSPGTTLLEQATSAGGSAAWEALTCHLKKRPSPTH
jgi:hypothetical protein